MTISKTKCECATSFVVDITSDYREFKSALGRGGHPTFIGRDIYRRSAANGGSFVFRYCGELVGVCLVNTRLSVATVLNVMPEHRNHGLGSAMLYYIQPNFCRVIVELVPWMERQHYKSIGEPKVGLRHKTQIMVRADLLPLAGRLRKYFGELSVAVNSRALMAATAAILEEERKDLT